MKQARVRVVSSLCLLVVLVGIATGCGPNRLMLQQAPAVPVTTEADVATVVFLRPSNYGAAARFMVVDGNGGFLGEMFGREYFVHTFPPGEHEFVAWSENAELVKANLAPGKIYYVLISVRMGIWRARMSISALTPKRDEWNKLSDWMRASRMTVPSAERVNAWAESRGPAIAGKIENARAVWDSMNFDKRGLRRLSPEDGFDRPQH